MHKKTIVLLTLSTTLLLQVINCSEQNKKSKNSSRPIATIKKLLSGDIEQGEIRCCRVFGPRKNNRPTLKRIITVNNQETNPLSSENARKLSSNQDIIAILTGKKIGTYTFSPGART